MRTCAAATADPQFLSGRTGIAFADRGRQSNGSVTGMKLMEMLCVREVRPMYCARGFGLALGFNADSDTQPSRDS
jgi:hypothetical protein